MPVLCHQAARRTGRRLALRRVRSGGAGAAARPHWRCGCRSRSASRARACCARCSSSLRSRQGESPESAWPDGEGAMRHESGRRSAHVAGADAAPSPRARLTSVQLQQLMAAIHRGRTLGHGEPPRWSRDQIVHVGGTHVEISGKPARSSSSSLPGCVGGTRAGVILAKRSRADRGDTAAAARSKMAADVHGGGPACPPMPGGQDEALHPR